MKNGFIICPNCGEITANIPGSCSCGYNENTKKKYIKVNLNYLLKQVVNSTKAYNEFRTNNDKICKTREDYENVMNLDKELLEKITELYTEIFKIEATHTFFYTYVPYIKQMKEYMEVETRIAYRLYQKSNGHIYTFISYWIDNKKAKHELQEFEQLVPKMQLEASTQAHIATERLAIKLIEASKEIDDEKYECEFNNGGYSYSGNVKVTLDYLDTIDVIDRKSAEYRENLIKEKDPEEFTYDDCIIYFDYLWHLEAGQAVGIVKKELENGRYSKALKRLAKIIDE